MVAVRSFRPGSCGFWWMARWACLNGAKSGRYLLMMDALSVVAGIME